MPKWLEKQQYIGLINGVEINNRRAFMCALEIIEKIEMNLNVSVDDEFIKDLAHMIEESIEEYNELIPTIIIEDELIGSADRWMDHADGLRFSINENTSTTEWFNDKIQNGIYKFMPIELER